VEGQAEEAASGKTLMSGWQSPSVSVPSIWTSHERGHEHKLKILGILA